MKLFWCLLSLLTVGAIFAEAGDLRFKGCREYVDGALHVRFPPTLDGLRLAGVTVSEDERGRFLTYRGNVENDPENGERTLTIAVFEGDGKPLPDGVNETVLAHFRDLQERDEEQIENEEWARLEPLGMLIEGSLGSSGVKYMWTSRTQKPNAHKRTQQAVLLIFAWRNSIVWLRHVEPIRRGPIAPCETMPDRFRKVLAEVDALLCAAQSAASRDLYAIADPKEALEAVRRKWLGVGETASPYDLPKRSAAAQELDRQQEWFSKDIAGRAARFETTCLEGIRLKLDPPRWLYNLACTRALLGRKDEAFEALEQALAAGYDDEPHLRRDTDLTSLRSDPRFERLAALSAAAKEDAAKNAPPARIESGRIFLDESNVRWNYDCESFGVDLANAPSNTLVYFDHSLEREQPPEDDVTAVEYDENFQDRKLDVGHANFHFYDSAARRSVPALMGCTATLRGNVTNCTSSVMAHIWENAPMSRNATWHLYANVLGVYQAYADYRMDGIDRLAGWSPVALAYADREQSEDLVHLCAEAWFALRPEVRERGGVRQIPGILRRCQSAVRSEDDFRSPLAQRPAILRAALDEARILKTAAALKDPYPETPYIASARLAFDPTPVTDMTCDPFNSARICTAPHGVSFVARWAERTCLFEIRLTQADGTLDWKVLQGDPDKVRFARGTPVCEDGANLDVMKIACDYHTAFDVPQTDGTTLRSTRVDIGCFRVKDGVSSLPAIVSIYFSPCETREYGADGKLAAIDYTQPQIPGWLPKFCPRGDFRDEFKWNADGSCAGWTRCRGDDNRTDFTPSGLAVMTRDALGRPLDVRRSRTMEWMQRLDPDVTEDLLGAVRQGSEEQSYDENDGPASRTTLAWRYAYANDEDRKGLARPLPPKPFRHRPRLCSRADFSKDSGFRLPLMRQMMLGLNRYTRFKLDLFEAGTPEWELPGELDREDGRLALASEDLVPPARLMRMRFCPFRPASNDVWRIDAQEVERAARTNMVELADGACRLCAPGTDNRDPTDLLSVRTTFRVQYTIGERAAYRKLDEAFRRCDEEETLKRMPAALYDAENDDLQVAGREPPTQSELREGVTKSVALWEVQTNLYFGIQANWASVRDDRRYFFCLPEENKPSTLLVTFEDLPSRAIGNTVCRGLADDPEAFNNLAVLTYGGVALPDSYPEQFVTELLTQAATKGCTTAIRNLGVLRYNRGETVKAALLLNARQP